MFYKYIWLQCYSIVVTNDYFCRHHIQPFGPGIAIIYGSRRSLC